MSREQNKPRVVVIGAGPAGLTAAYQLIKHGVQPMVLEADPTYVGGIARTASYKGYGFDIGGHRFFSKSREVEALWDEILPGGMITRPRKSRIYYRGKFFAYPLKPMQALKTLGALEAGLCGVSYLRARAFPVREPKNFEQWVVNQFGQRLYEIFFKHYTEKVWGMRCTEISADWAAQRIKGLSLSSAVLSALKPKPKSGDGVIKTLIDEFRYPPRGPGQLWEVCAERVREGGGEVRLGRRVTGLERTAGGGWRVFHEGEGGKQPERDAADHVICSAPMREVVAGLAPAPPEPVRAAAAALRYRDFLTVVLIAKDRGTFDDNWIYIQDGDVTVGRIQNFKAWSEAMVPEPGMACYGLEYFCFEGDGLWSSSDEALLELGKREMSHLGLVHAADVVDGCVVRMPKAYPVYDDAYERNVELVRAELAAHYEGLHLVGRNGMHRYNNQDHAMMTAMLVVENIIAGRELYDVWRVNQDAEYIESGAAGEEDLLRAGGRSIPGRA
ncbi:MAG: NAD(P)/FAD-dependent oxidoreductase [Myxococcales bacterium]|nr:NAD(P)/FAD-dependent oxidoreductase [Myxococcales bacterium]